MPPVQLISPRIMQISLGFGALLLPFALILWVLLPFQLDDQLQPTMSEFIYTAANPIFIGALFSISVLFFSYQGYPGRAGRTPFSDRQIAWVAAVGALMTGLFPSDTCLMQGGQFVVANPWDLAWTGEMHFIGAVMLFGAGGWLSLFHFPLSDKINPNAMKRKRQRVHRFSGIGIFALTVALVALNIFASNKDCSRADSLSAIFFVEAGMTMLFALAWITKAQVILADKS